MKQLNLQEKNEIIVRYIKGESENDLCKEYGVSKRELESAINNEELRSDTERRHIAITQSRESRKIDEAKDQILQYITATLKEVNENPESLSVEKKISFFDKVSSMMSSIDKVSRLNREQSTSNDTTSEKKVVLDVAEVVKALQTPEQKKEFLRNQLAIT